MEARIARYNQVIIIQKHETIVDKYKNHRSAWVDQYACHAYISTYIATDEHTAAGAVVTEENRPRSFECRYCSELKDVTAKEYRIRHGNSYYNITSVDPMNYQYKTIKFKAVYDGEASA